MKHHSEIRYWLSIRALELMRFVSLVGFQDEKFGRRANDVLILMAVHIGHHENKPMTAAKIAHYVGMARPTAIRRINLMVREGVLRYNESKQVCFSKELEQRAESIMPMLKQSRILRNVAYLSKMDIGHIAANENQ